MFYSDAIRTAVRALRANATRSILTAIGMMIGNASVILVVTISLTSREYVLEQIQGIGSNMIFAYYEAGSQSTARVEADFIKLADIEAVRQQLGEKILAATGVMTNYDRLYFNGQEEDVAVLGSDSAYREVRNLAVLAGRFLDDDDVESRRKVALLTDKLAIRLFGNTSAAVGQTLKVHGLQFTVVGTFRERVSSFGQSELVRETILIPITVLRYFTPTERIDPMYIKARSAEDVESITAQVRQVIEARHRRGAHYRVDNLGAILGAARNISFVLSAVLILVSAIALIISGVGIMNIMLVTVTERTREIGIRMSVGATRRSILRQFLVEATLIGLSGGLAGIVIGVSIPLLANVFLDPLHLPISGSAVALAFGVSLATGLLFGLLPARRASRLNPTEALRYE